MPGLHYQPKHQIRDKAKGQYQNLVDRKKLEIEAWQFALLYPQTGAVNLHHEALQGNEEEPGKEQHRKIEQGEPREKLRQKFQCHINILPGLKAINLSPNAPAENKRDCLCRLC
jgi:hypothetical protein